MNNITVVIWAYNQEKNIGECITSAKLLTEDIILIDLESTDNTAILAQKKHCQIIKHPNQKFVEPVREFGIQQAKTDWIFLLDADERITPEIAKEVQQTICTDGACPVSTKNITHYRLPRKNIFSGKKWFKHGGWWPDYQIRIINKKYFISWPKTIHSTPLIQGQGGYFKNALLHFSHKSLAKMVNTTLIFEDQESDLLFAANKPVNTLTFFRKFWGELFRRLIKNLGFLDGNIGIIESIYQAFSKTITYLFLYEKKNRRSL